MKWTSHTPLILLALILSACASTVTPVATGGSKADGIVRMSYEYEPLGSVEVDHSASWETAVRRCQAWGYSEAEAFGGATEECIRQHPEWGCVKYRATTEYQCTGANGQTNRTASNRNVGAAGTNAVAVSATGARSPETCQALKSLCEEVCPVAVKNPSEECPWRCAYDYKSCLLLPRDRHTPAYNTWKEGQLREDKQATREEVCDSIKETCMEACVDRDDDHRFSMCRPNCSLSHTQCAFGNQ